MKQPVWLGKKELSLIDEALVDLWSYYNEDYTKGDNRIAKRIAKLRDRLVEPQCDVSECNEQ